MPADPRTDYESQGHVSVWLGSFPDEATFEAYLDEIYNEDGDSTCLFWNDLGLTWLDHDFYESHHEPERPVPIDRLIPGVSYIESFGPALKAACAAQGIHTARTGIFAFDLAYPKNRPFPCPHLKFAGVFAYSKR